MDRFQTVLQRFAKKRTIFLFGGAPPARRSFFYLKNYLPYETPRPAQIIPVDFQRDSIKTSLQTLRRISAGTGRLGSCQHGRGHNGRLPHHGRHCAHNRGPHLRATSQFAGALTALTVFARAMLLLPVIEEPYAALSPIVIQGGLAATDFKSFGMGFRGNRTECLIMIATLAMSLGISVIEGLLLGIGLSVFQLVHNVARPNIVICGQVADGTFRDLRYYPDAHSAPGCVVVRMDASLCFPNTRRLQEFCLQAAAMAGAATES